MLIFLMTCLFLHCMSPTASFEYRKLVSTFKFALEKAQTRGNESAVEYILQKHPGFCIQIDDELLRMDPLDLMSTIFQKLLNLSKDKFEEFFADMIQKNTVVNKDFIVSVLKVALEKAEQDDNPAAFAHILHSIPLKAIEVEDKVWKMEAMDFVSEICRKILPTGEAKQVLDAFESKYKRVEKLPETDLVEDTPKLKSKRRRQKKKHKVKDDHQDQVEETYDEEASGENMNQEDQNQEMSQVDLNEKLEEQNNLVAQLRKEIEEKDMKLRESRLRRETLERELKIKEAKIAEDVVKLRESRLRRENMEALLKKKDKEILDMKSMHVKHIDRCMKIASLRYISNFEDMRTPVEMDFLDLESKAFGECCTCAQSVLTMPACSGE